MDELIRLGFRAYLCGDMGRSITLIWARTVYQDKGDGLTPDWVATFQRVEEVSRCRKLARARLEPSLVGLMGGAVRVTEDDLGIRRLQPAIRLS